MKRYFTVLGIVLLTLIITGCARRVVVYEKPPAPPPKVEVRPARPYRGAVWVPGHWKWRKGRYIWISGHWRRP